MSFKPYLLEIKERTKRAAIAKGHVVNRKLDRERVPAYVNDVVKKGDKFYVALTADRHQGTVRKIFPKNRSYGTLIQTPLRTDGDRGYYSCTTQKRRKK